MVKGSGRASVKGRLPPKLSHRHYWLGGVLSRMMLAGRPRTVTTMLTVLIHPTPSLVSDGSQFLLAHLRLDRRRLHFI